ncbi:MAG TPA: phosphoenolpyruvate carboxykinase (GTP) [Clostridiaceae bacterium]|nr:phosphoenolpyruvate carboxykinase (GTP) [Clostridiaceae bacterium]
MIKNEKLKNWVEELTSHLTPDHVYLCDGTKEEYDRLLAQEVKRGAAIPLNPELRPNSFLFRSDPSDVARVEDRTFIASETKDDAGPTNNWIDPVQLRKTMSDLYKGCMKGRTMYIIPFCMGPLSSPASRLGVEITDSAYVVVNMHIMARVGNEALERINQGEFFVPALHSVGYPLEPGQEDPLWPCAPMEQKYIAHFPETREIWSYGSGYGGNALLGKKCYALRIASVLARDEGWMAEHMLILKLISPEGKVYHICGAFPSACGKTNLAMINPSLEGWTAETVGDDISWLRFGPDGRLWAINPEAGFFGVAPGTSYKSNYNAMKAVEYNTIFTNTALTDEGDVWWEDIGTPAPAHLIDWQGRDWTPESKTNASHPNARFTVRADQAPSIAPDWEAPEGVPIDAILVGGRRSDTIPLVYQSTSWQHGVFLGAVMGSAITSAVISDKIGQIRRDPFAMLPFIGYHIGDYLHHWLNVGKRTDPDKLPLLFSVNWFRKNNDGKFIWPGFGENSRVLKWIVGRCEGTADAEKTAIGYVPQAEDLDLAGLSIAADSMAELLKVDKEEWQTEAASIRENFVSYGPKLPVELLHELESLEERLQS